MRLGGFTPPFLVKTMAVRRLEPKQDNETEEQYEVRLKLHQSSVASDGAKLKEIREAFDKKTRC